MSIHVRDELAEGVIVETSSADPLRLGQPRSLHIRSHTWDGVIVTTHSRKNEKHRTDLPSRQQRFIKINDVFLPARGVLAPLKPFTLVTAKEVKRWITSFVLPGILRRSVKVEGLCDPQHGARQFYPTRARATTAKHAALAIKRKTVRRWWSSKRMV